MLVHSSRHDTPQAQPVSRAQFKLKITPQAKDNPSS